MRAHKSVLLLLILLSTLSLVTALPPVSIEIADSPGPISSDASATYSLDITNNGNEVQSYYLSAPRSKWDITFEDYYLQIQPGETVNTHIRMAPPIDTPVGRYGIYTEIRSADTNKVLEYKYLHVSVDKTVGVKPVPVEPEKIREVTITEEASVNKVLKRSYTFLIENTGDLPVEDIWKETFSKFDMLLLTSNSEYISEDYGKQKQVFWSYSLDPGESVRISYAISYMPLVWAVILLTLASAMFVFYYHNKFKVKKSLMSIKEDGKKGLKVEIVVKNKTRKVQKKITVEDYIPIPFELVKRFSTVEPDKINKHGNYTKLVWTLGELSPKDERVLSYSIKSKLKVLGKLTLPQAVLIQKKGKKGTKESASFSGEVHMFGHDLDK